MPLRLSSGRGEEEHTPTAARRSHWPSSTAVTGGLHRQRIFECGALAAPCQERWSLSRQPLAARRIASSGSRRSSAGTSDRMLVLIQTLKERDGIDVVFSPAQSSRCSSPAIAL